MGGRSGKVKPAKVKVVVKPKRRVPVVTVRDAAVEPEEEAFDVGPDDD